MKKIFFYFSIFFTVSLFAEIVKTSNNEYTVEIRFNSAYITTNIDCNSKVQDVLFFFNSEKKEFKKIVCDAKLNHPFMDEKEFNLSNLSFDLAFENFDEILDNKFHKITKLNEYDISSNSFKVDLKEYFIPEKDEVPVLVNKGPIKTIIFKDNFKVKDLSFKIRIKKDGYRLDAFSGYQNLRLVDEYIFNTKKISSTQKNIVIDGIILDNTKTKLTNSYKHGVSECIDGDLYLFPEETFSKKRGNCNWVEL